MSWAWVVQPGDDRKKIYGAGDEYSFMATGEHTDGHYFFVEAMVPPSGGPPPHIQTREEEGFYVTEGELIFRAAGKRVVARPGTFVPAGIEGMFEKMAADPENFVAIAKEYGVEFVDEA